MVSWKMPPSSQAASSSRRKVSNTSVGGAPAGDLLRHVSGPQHQIALGRERQNGVELVNPAMDADLVAFVDQGALLLGIEHRGDCGHVEGGLHAVLFQERADTRHAHPV